jgi:multiple antibiotic resistance protein
MLTAMIVVLAWIVLWFSHGIARFLGRSGIRIVSKVVHLILAAIAVKMVRTGVEGVVERMAQAFPR